MNGVRTIVIVILALVVFSPTLSVAGDSCERMIVGREGAILRLQSGAYGVLFPEGFEADPESKVLSLDVLQSSSTERMLVPNTENRDEEAISALYFDKDSGLTYLLWEGLVNGIHPFLNLASFDGSQWSEVIPIAGSVFADKGTSNLVIVPETDPKLKAAPVTEMPATRTVIYVAWQEESAIGGGENFLVPVILEDGEYVGWRKVFNLSDLSSIDKGATSANNVLPRSIADPNLKNLLAIQPSTKGNAVAIGIINHTTGRFVTLEVEMLPLALSALVERVKELIIQNAQSSGSVEELIDHVQTALLADGTDFHPSILEYLADRLGELLADLPTVASAAAPDVLEKAGIYMVDIGARVRRKGLLDLEPLGIFSLAKTPDGRGPYSYLKFSLIAERDAPIVEGPATVFLSRTGDHALVAWAGESVVYFRETQGEIWSEVQQVEFREGLDEETVYRILAERTMSR